jgi:hypothetical protein
VFQRLLRPLLSSWLLSRLNDLLLLSTLTLLIIMLIITTHKRLVGPIERRVDPLDRFDLFKNTLIYFKQRTKHEILLFHFRHS